MGDGNRPMVYIIFQQAIKPCPYTGRGGGGGGGGQGGASPFQIYDIQHSQIHILSLYIFIYMY